MPISRRKLHPEPVSWPQAKPAWAVAGTTGLIVERNGSRVFDKRREASTYRSSLRPSLQAASRVVKVEVIYREWI